MTRRVPCNYELLCALMEVLLMARPQDDRTSIVPVPYTVLEELALALVPVIGKKSKGSPEKLWSHIHWATTYWHHRALSPPDIDGAIRAVQTLALPWLPTPTPERIKRVARALRPAVFAIFERDAVADLKPLLAHLRKRGKREPQ